MNTKFYKEIDGNRYVQSRKNIEIIQDGLQIYCPDDDTLYSNGWELYIEPAPTEEDLYKSALQEKIDVITAYDTSTDVNEFYIQGIPLWLDKSTRVGLMLRFQAEQSQGKTHTTLWQSGMAFPLPIELGLHMLYELEVYASECYDNTQKHLAEIHKLTTIEDLKAYNYTLGYPEKLQFYVEEEIATE